MYTIIPEELEKLHSLVSISAVREWCMKPPQKTQIHCKIALKHFNIGGSVLL